MTAMLSIDNVVAEDSNLAGMSPVSPGKLPRIAAAAIGDDDIVPAVLRTALGVAAPMGEEVCGLLVCFRSSAGQSPAEEFERRIGSIAAGPAGLPVGLIGVGADVSAVSSQLAWMCAAARDLGCRPVGPGLWVDPADISLEANGCDWSDVTVAADLSRLVNKLRVLAGARHTLHFRN
ncbi:hypothetical protein ACFYXQ_15445 [Nocardia jiangxiensis]|uniref:Uncharacterized protein n=1 Tax=Nocardia jiangxiensis TaxID=282685 RepID=A0ABW6RYS1_9NOCA